MRSGKADAAPVSSWRGRNLPVGMTACCAEELARLFADFEAERVDGLAEDAALTAFEVVARHHRPKI
jgi:hypothetical protein